jgi:NitT/TauT family transport system ATP-binding protein
MIQVKDLCFNYGSEAVLKDINLNIEKNTTCAIIGPSGCGKTTLLYVMSGLLTAQGGCTFINGVELKGVRKSTGMILQNTGLLPWKTVFDNVGLGLKTRGVNKKTINEKVNLILDELEMIEHKNKFPEQLSGGQKQRVAIARTLVTEPDVLLLDEASSALDAITKENIQNLILNIYKKKPMTTVLVTHNIEEAVFLGQKIVVMERSAIKHIIDNPYFGDEEIRSKSEYYNVCFEVRKWLYEGARL